MIGVILQSRIRQYTTQFQWKLLSLVVVALFALLMGGCSAVGPDYVKPEAPVLESWNETPMQALEQEGGEDTYNTWWEVFSDPVLQNLIEKACSQNLTLQIAAIRIYEARAQLGILVGNLYPQQQLGSGSLTTNKSTKTSEDSPIDNTFDALNLGFDATWEVDIWGKYRRSVQSGVANLEATVASYNNVLVSLTAEVARTYILLRTLERRLLIANKNTELQRDSLHVAEVMFTNGAVSELDVSQAKSLLYDTQASIPRLESSLWQARNAMAILMGVLPGTLTKFLEGPPVIPSATESVFIDIPKNLLRRRPDIRLSELQIAAQSPQIGVAKADLYPHFFLFGSIGWTASNAHTASGDNSLGDIFSDKSLYWSAGPGFSWDIFNYGRIKNRIRVEDARLQQLVVEYKETVLNAQCEVEDAMVAYLRAREEEGFLKESVEEARRSVDLSLIQYKEGLVDYQRVLDSQRFLAGQFDKLTEVSGDVATNLVTIYKALGGGWQVRQEEDILSAENREQMTNRTSWGGLLRTEN